MQQQKINRQKNDNEKKVKGIRPKLTRIIKQLNIK